MVWLIAATSLFLLLHLLIAGTPVRGLIVNRIGEGPYLGLFSLASVLGLVWVAMAFVAAKADPANLVWWSATPSTKALQLVLSFIAFQFVVVGLSTPNPTSVKQEGVLDKPDAINGVLRVTRHPFLWGVAIWAVGHMLVNGRIVDLELFLTMLVLAIFGAMSIDAKRKRSLGSSWDSFAGQTSSVPFAAILAGRQKFNLSEIGWPRLMAGAGVWAAQPPPAHY